MWEYSHAIFFRDNINVEKSKGRLVKNLKMRYVREEKIEK
jgi:hypothetical protein